MVLQRGLGHPFWCPGGGSRPPFWVSKGPMWPVVPPRRIYGGFWCSFWRSSGIQNLSIVVLILDVFSGWFVEWF